MKLGWLLGVSCAVLFHALVLLFGGIFFLDDEQDHGTLQEVELLTTEAEAAEKPPETKPEEEPLEAETEPPPDATEILRSLEPSIDDGPALDAASLGALEQLLSGQGGAGDFGTAVSLASGGSIGASGALGVGESTLEKTFNLDEIDQDARLVDQINPTYPTELRSQKLEGSVQVKFIVDSSGRVGSPKVLESTHNAFVKPALDALRQWKFEPAVKSGRRVSCFKRVVIRFKPSQGT